MNTGIVEVTDANFSTEVEQSGLPVFLDFWSPGCAPCKAIAPVLEQLAGAYAGRVKFASVGYENEALIERFDIEGFPTLLLLKGGREIAERRVGVQSKSHYALLLDAHAGPAPAMLPAPRRAWCAFHDDAALKHAVIDQVAMHLDADEVGAAGALPPVSDEAKGTYSLIGAALHGGDLHDYEEKFGIPAHVAVTEEILHSLLDQPIDERKGQPRFAFRGATRDYPLDWLSHIPLGADLWPVTSRFVAWLLHDLVDVPLPCGAVVSDAIKPAVRDLAALHARAATGHAPAATEWRSARERIHALAPGFAEDPVSHGVAHGAEAVAWPAEELGGELAVLLHDVLHSALRESAIRCAYAEAQWARRQAARQAMRKKYAELGMSDEALRASIEFKAFRASEQSFEESDDAALQALKNGLGERWHSGLMAALAGVAEVSAAAVRPAAAR